MGEIRCTTLANKMQNTKLILCLLGAALVAGAFAANTCSTCASGATTCSSSTCSGSQKCLVTSYVSTTNYTTTGCDTASVCSTYSIANNACKKVTIIWDYSYYCSTTTPAWAVTAAKNRYAFPSTVSCPVTSAFAITAKGLAGWVISHHYFHLRGVLLPTDHLLHLLWWHCMLHWRCCIPKRLNGIA